MIQNVNLNDLKGEPERFRNPKSALRKGGEEMAERNPQDWGTYLDELIVLFDSLPEGHKIHGKTKADVVAMRAGLTNGINAVTSGESTLGFSRGALKTIVSGVDDFATHVIPALTGDFGPDSVEVQEAPRKQLPDHGGGGGGTSGGGGGTTPVPS